jgi:hypothetical protein
MGGTTYAVRICFNLLASAASASTEMADASSRRVASLGERSMQVGTFIGTIRAIADQTDLLALNAAIDAPHARVHQLGKQTLAAHAAGDKTKARALCAEMKESAMARVGMLDQLLDSSYGHSRGAATDGGLWQRRCVASSAALRDALRAAAVRCPALERIMPASSIAGLCAS